VCAKNKTKKPLYAEYSDEYLKLDEKGTQGENSAGSPWISDNKRTLRGAWWKVVLKAIPSNSIAAGCRRGGMRK